MPPAVVGSLNCSVRIHLDDFIGGIVFFGQAEGVLSEAVENLFKVVFPAVVVVLVELRENRLYLVLIQIRRVLRAGVVRADGLLLSGIEVVRSGAHG